MCRLWDPKWRGGRTERWAITFSKQNPTTWVDKKIKKKTNSQVTSPRTHTRHDFNEIESQVSKCVWTWVRKTISSLKVIAILESCRLFQAQNKQTHLHSWDERVDRIFPSRKTRLKCEWCLHRALDCEREKRNSFIILIGHKLGIQYQ